VVIPAYNETACLGATLEHLRAACARLAGRGGPQAEIIVVDNGSTDGTATLAAQLGARVVSEAVRNIARVRNTGARASRGETIVFVDADTLIPPETLSRIEEEMRDPGCAGGAPDLRYRPRRRVMRWYLEGWRWFATLGGMVTGAMAMGATQFCRRDIFDELAGYDETIFMGEDLDFFWRLQKLARRRGLRVAIIRDVTVCPSSRRFDQWPLWRILVWTNPFFLLALRRRRMAWTGWLAKPVR
jgi:glycosyltransferase involved in cell wall biosynthesis